MASGGQFFFAPYRLDPVNAQLWQGDTQVNLRRKTFDVLVYLVEHPARLVTKAELLDAVWPDLSVSDSMPAVSIRELRKALGDEAKSPNFIETVHGRGYCFIAKVTNGASMEPASKPQPLANVSKTIIVGRDEETTRLRGWYAQVLEGARRVVFVTGEAGIGKSAIVNAFWETLASEGSVGLARGQCIEKYGAGEPYMPVLEALTRLGQGAGGERVVAQLNRFAPTWLAQMPALLTPEQSAHLQVQNQGVKQQRMLREMVLALEALTAEAPLVLMLEDLHWSDYSTLELISALARRNEPARLLVLGTHRPLAMLAHDHPLRAMKQGLALHHHCEDLQLRLMNQGNIAEYLKRRFSSNTRRTFEGLAPVIHERTDGNPMFMVNVIDYLVDARLLTNGQEESAEESTDFDMRDQIEVPGNLRQMIERNLEQLNTEEQSMLEAASVAGMEFSASAVAAALERQEDEVESCLFRLARREQFVAVRGPITWPYGTVALGFRFLHWMYQEVLYDLLPLAHRVRFHRLIAASEERGYGEHADQIANELAHHYGSANDRRKQTYYLQLAGERAFGCGALTEAELHYTRALQLLAELPSSAERDRQQFVLQTLLLNVLWTSKSWMHPVTISAVARLRELATKLEEKSFQFAEIVHIASVLGSGQFKSARELAEGALLKAERMGDRASLCAAHAVFGQALLWRAEYVDAVKHFELTISYHKEGDPGEWGLDAYAFGPIPVLVLGYADQARALMHDALAQHCSYLDRKALMHIGACIFFALLRDASAVTEHARELKGIVAERPIWLGASDLYMSQALMIEGRWEEGIRQLHKAIAFHNEIGLPVFRTSEILCESAFLMGQGQNDQAEALIDGAVNHTEALGHLAPALLQRANLLAQNNSEKSAIDEAYRAAINCARGQGAKYYELQAVTHFARWLRLQGRAIEGRKLLADVYGWFTEGFDTPVLKEAKVLLDELISKSAVSIFSRSRNIFEEKEARTTQRSKDHG